MRILKLGCALFLAVAMASCMTSHFTNKVYYTDYSNLSKQGFFVTESNSVSFDYEPIGSMVLQQESGQTKVKVEKEKKKVTGYDDIYGEERPQKQPKTKSNYKWATAQGAMADFAAEAKQRGANGVIGLKITYGPEYSVIVSGMIIKK